MERSFQSKITMPFLSEVHAEMVKACLEVDDELQPEKISKEFVLALGAYATPFSISLRGGLRLSDDEGIIIRGCSARLIRYTLYLGTRQAKIFLGIQAIMHEYINKIRTAFDDDSYRRSWPVLASRLLLLGQILLSSVHYPLPLVEVVDFPEAHMFIFKELEIAQDLAAWDDMWRTLFSADQKWWSFNDYLLANFCVDMCAECSFWLLLYMNNVRTACLYFPYFRIPLDDGDWYIDEIEVLFGLK